MRRLIGIWILCVGILTSANAQTYTQRIQKQNIGPATVTIHQSDSIDQLVNSEVLGYRGAAKPTPQPNAGNTSTSGNSSTSSTSSSSSTSSNTSATNPAGQEEGAQQPRATYKTVGYRVQAFAGGNSRADRQKAERVKNSIKSYYPNVPVYVHFFSPRWICRVGNYKTYEEAHQMMTNLKNMGFNECTIVKGKITVAY